jgi:hypothetical protein
LLYEELNFATPIPDTQEHDLTEPAPRYQPPDNNENPIAKKSLYLFNVMAMLGLWPDQSTFGLRAQVGHADSIVRVDVIREWILTSPTDALGLLSP